jgi:hypothetical protein
MAAANDERNKLLQHEGQVPLSGATRMLGNMLRDASIAELLDADCC